MKSSSAVPGYVYVEYGDQRGEFEARTAAMELAAEDPHVFEFTGLDPDTEYFYRLRFKQPEADVFQASTEYDFHTQRRRGTSFNFAVQADPHMGARTRFQKWCGDRCNRESANDVSFDTTVANMIARNPDFLVDLGDTFMTSQNHGNGMFEIQNRQRGAPIREAEVISDYVYLRNVLSRAASTTPLFLVPGNHDTERQTRLDGTPDNLSVWANNARKTYYPTPTDNGFYTGGTEEVDFIGRHDGHYAWEWGDPLTEEYEFDRYREGWGLPIHRMLVENGVNIVFHGHDHMYVKEVHRDGIVYQETPTPGGTGEPGDVMLGAARMGYDTENGIIFSSSGFLDVSVSPDEVTVEYIQNIYDCERDCGEVVDSYTIPAK